MPSTNFFDIIVAYDDNFGIGKDGKIPWLIPGDLDRFRQITTKTNDPTKRNMIIMGSGTFKSIGRILPNRLNVILSKKEVKTVNSTNDKIILNTLSEALSYGFSNKSIERIFVIGGQDIYREAIVNEYLRDIYTTQIMGDYRCDRIFTIFGPGSFYEYMVEPYRQYNDYQYRYVTYRNMTFSQINESEEQYRNLVNYIINFGDRTKFRNGYGQYIFEATTLRYDLREGFPLTTIRSLPLRSIFSELIWMLSGSTDVLDLKKRGCHIWDANSSRGFLDSNGKSHLKEFDVGPTYGFQWRHFGAIYVDCKTNYKGLGFDQLTNLIENLKYNPESRRHVVSLWNPRDIDDAALPPCMYEFVFNVGNRTYLDMDVRIRSSDVAVGLPWNIASSALLLTMIATVTKYIPRKLNITLDNAHIYEQNLEKLQNVIKRTPKMYGRLSVIRIPDEVTNFQFTDFELTNYNPHPGVNFDMVA